MALDKLGMQVIACGCAMLFVMHAQAHEGVHGDAAAIGSPGRAADVTRTVRIVMSDAMRFTPSRVRVTQGETVRFALKNAGKLKHEFVLGTASQLAAHARMMRSMPDMDHSDPNMLSLEGGADGEVIWHFAAPGTVAFACVQAGHYEAGMKGVVRVSGHGTH